MDNKIIEIFNKVHAEEKLKRKTTNYLYAEMKKRKSMRQKWSYAIACMSLILILIGGGFSYNIYFTPIAYIDIDVNPSIELTLNRFGRVIHSNAYNDDGMTLLGKVNLLHADYNKALEKLLAALNGDGYFDEESLLCVTVQADKGDRESLIQDSLQETIDIISLSHHYNIETDIFTVTEEIKHCAAENHVSPARYLAIQELLEIDSDADFEECKDHSIPELRKQIEEHCGSHRQEELPQENGSHSHGHGGSGSHH